MAVATTIPRYNKNQKILVDDEELTLIQHLKNLRTSNNITKKRISNIIKQNDYWYSQIERDGKKGDDNRQVTIYKPDLIDIISIVKYGANSISELSELHEKSQRYLEKEIHAVPLTESIKKLEWYQINPLRTDQEQDSLFNSLSASITKLLEKTYYSLSSRADKDNFLNALREIKASMKIDPLFIIFLLGQPLSRFLYEADERRIKSLIQDITRTIDGFYVEDGIKANNDPYLTKLKEVLDEYIGDTKYLQRKKYDIIPEDHTTLQ